jgi:hypothetical protein
MKRAKTGSGELAPSNEDFSSLLYSLKFFTEPNPTVFAPLSSVQECAKPGLGFAFWARLW